MKLRHVLLLLFIGLSGQSFAQSTFQTMEFTVPTDDIQLYCKMYLPQREGPYATVVLLHGAGKLESEFYRPFAEKFAAMGYACVLFDKRGTGKSGGKFMEVSLKRSDEVFNRLASDAESVIKYVSTLEIVNPSMLGVFGTSQGGWIASIVLSRCAEAQFAIVASGPSSTYGEEDLFSELTGDEKPGQSYDNNGMPISEAIERVKKANSKKGFDPMPYLRRLRVPTIYMYGEMDRSVPVQICVENLESIDSKFFTVKVYPNANHSFIHIDTNERVDIFKDVEQWMETIKSRTEANH